MTLTAGKDETSDAPIEILALFLHEEKGIFLSMPTAKTGINKFLV
jgi:hypothetical protein